MGHLFLLGNIAMSVKPELSVIIPVKNAEKTLRLSVLSVLRQQFSDLEIIIVDNNSTDNSFGLAQAFQNIDARVKAFLCATPGPGAARNYGLQKASGEFVLFLDADNTLLPDALPFLLNEIKSSNADAAIGNKIVSGGPQAYRNLQEWHRNRSKGLIDIGEDKSCITETLPDNGSTLFRMSIIKRYSVEFGDGFMGEDYVFRFSYFAAAQTALFLDAPIIEFNIREDSAQHTHKSFYVIEGGTDFILRLADFMRRNNLRNSANVKMLEYLIAKIINIMVQNRGDCSASMAMTYLRKKLRRLMYSGELKLSDYPLAALTCSTSVNQVIFERDFNNIWCDVQIALRLQFDEPIKKALTTLKSIMQNIPENKIYKIALVCDAEFWHDGIFRIEEIRDIHSPLNAIIIKVNYSALGDQSLLTLGDYPLVVLENGIVVDRDPAEYLSMIGETQ
jgi:glycosyltransferase involved in cell wall biosynthesis